MKPTPRLPVVCQVPAPLLPVTLKEECGQLFSTSAHNNLSSCSLCNSEEGSDSYPAAWHCGDLGPPKL